MQIGSAKFSKFTFALSLVLTVLSAFSAQAAADHSLSNDPIFNAQWALKNTGQPIPIDLDSNHTLEQTGTPGLDIGWVNTESLVVDPSKPTIVAVIDTGLDLTVPSLAGRIQPDGKDFCDGDTLTDPIGHGTHVTGIIAGISPSSVKILPLRVLHPDMVDDMYKNRLLSDYAADAIDYAVAHGASVINLSFGWPKVADTAKAHDSIENAEKKGVLVIAAAGNDRKDLPIYPCAYPGVVCVGAESNNGNAAFFSDYGSEIDLTAPGDSVISIFPRLLTSSTLRMPGYERMNGTSQAAPFVSGIAATIKAIHPELTVNDLKARLFNSAGFASNPDISHYGMVNLKKALQMPKNAVFLPDFKNLIVSVDQSGSHISGVIPIHCYGECAETPSFTLKSLDPHTSFEIVNSDPLKDYQIALHFGGKIDILKVSEQIPFEIQGPKGSVWRGKLQIARSPQQMTLTGKYIYPKKNLPMLRFLGGKNYSVVKQIDNLFDSRAMPEYYGVFVRGQITVIRPSSDQKIATVTIPNNERVGEVIKLDADLDQIPDYVILGYLLDDQQNVSQMTFHFFSGSNFSPLYGPYSNWRVDFTADATAALSIRNFGRQGSWTPMPTNSLHPPSGFKFPKNILVPSFIARGKWPKKDNYDEFTTKHFQVMNHYYYLEPSIKKSELVLSPRTIDSSSFYDAIGTQEHVLPQESVNFIDFLSPSQVLISIGNQFDQRYFVFNITSTASSIETINPLTISDTHMSGQSQAVLSPTDIHSSWSGFSEFFDTNGRNARMMWLNPATSEVRHIDIKSLSLISPLMGTIGFGNNGQDLFALVRSRYDLIALKQKHDGTIVQSAISINHDSSFSAQDYQDTITPVLFSPQPGETSINLGAYIDSTRLVGNTIGTALWDPESESFRKQARYSLNISPECVPMGAFTSPKNGALNYSLLCDENDHWEFRYLAP